MGGEQEKEKVREMKGHRCPILSREKIQDRKGECQGGRRHLGDGREARDAGCPVWLGERVRP